MPWFLMPVYASYRTKEKKWAIVVRVYLCQRVIFAKQPDHKQHENTGEGWEEQESDKVKKKKKKL